MPTISPARHRRPLAVAALGAAILVALTGCSLPTGDSAGGSGGGTLQIGVLAPQTGTSAADGLLAKQGAQLAIEEINAAGGVDGHKLALDVQDTKDQSAAAVTSAVSNLTSNSKVVAVATAYASTTNFEINQLSRAKLPYLLGGNSAQTAGIVGKNPTAFPTIWSVAPSYSGYNTDLPRQLAAWDTSGEFPLRNKKAFIVSSNNPFSNGIADGLTKTFHDEGWTVVGPDAFPFQNIDDWTTEIGKIHAADPSVVINLDYQTANAASFLRQFSQNPTQSLVFSQYAPTVPDFEKLAGDSANGVVTNLPFAPLPKSKLGAAAIAAFQKKFGADPGLTGVALYTEIKLWAAAAKKVGDPTKTAQVGAAIGKLDEPTALGTVRFDPKTHLAVAGSTGIHMTYYQVQDGKLLLIGPAADAVAKFEKPSWVTP